MAARLSKVVQIPPVLAERISAVVQQKGGNSVRELRHDHERLRESFSSQRFTITPSPMSSTTTTTTRSTPAPPVQSLRQKRKTVVLFGERETAAYLAGQMHIHYAQSTRVMLEISAKLPEFKPRTILDFGCGPATSAWAIESIWPRSMDKYVGVDLSEAMLASARGLIDGSRRGLSTSDGVPDSDRVKLQRYLSASSASTRHDMVVAQSVLCELPSDSARVEMLRTLWRKTGGVLVVIDNGGPESFRIVANARQMVLDLAREDGDNAHVVAPCSHDSECPMLLGAGGKKSKHCEFTLRVQRTSLSQAVRKAKNDNERAHMCYFVIHRSARPSDNDDYNTPRILSFGRAKKHVNMKVCDQDGELDDIRVFKDHVDSSLYRAAKGLSEGTQVPRTVLDGVGETSSKSDEDVDDD
eukprot:Partr_v1_DN24923_c0_g1_i2_m45393 putative 37S ribosomal protein RSM22